MFTFLIVDDAELSKVLAYAVIFFSACTIFTCYLNFRVILVFVTALYIFLSVRLQSMFYISLWYNNVPHFSLQGVAASPNNALLQSTSLGHADAPMNNVTHSKTQGSIDPHTRGSYTPGPSNCI